MVSKGYCLLDDVNEEIQVIEDCCSRVSKVNFWGIVEGFLGAWYEGVGIGKEGVYVVLVSELSYTVV